MEQNTNLLINVINNITVTNTILISIAIIVGSVEITVMLNKGIIILIFGNLKMLHMKMITMYIKILLENLIP